MKTIYEQTKEIQDMHQNLRLVGYIVRNTKLTEYLATLRLKKDDEEWTDAEAEKWEDLCEEIEPWWYALSKEEQDFLKPINTITAILANGENIKDNPSLEGG